MIRNKYEKLGYAIMIELPKSDYLVRANIVKLTDKDFDVTLEMRRADIGKWDTLDENVYHLKTDNINTTVCETIGELNRAGFFGYFIKRYEYDLKCSDIGNGIIEAERVAGK